MKKRNLPIILSLLLFLLLTAIAVMNFLYINNVGNKLTEMTRSVAVGGSALELRQYWEAQLSPVSITVSNSAIERLTDAIDTLVCYVESGRDEEIARSIAITLNAIEGIRRLERISISNLM